MVNDDGYSMVNDGYNLVGGIPTPLKIMLVSWDFSSQYMESHNKNVPNHQPAMVSSGTCPCSPVGFLSNTPFMKSPV